MKLHLPVSLRRAVMKVLTALALPLATTVASGHWTELTADKGLGNTMFVGDSITHGTNGDMSWRWQMHKIFVDNGIKYKEVGVVTGNDTSKGALNADVAYGNSIWRNVHSSYVSVRSYEVSGDGNGGHFGNTSIMHWLGTTGDDDPTNAAFRLSDSDEPVNTFFMLLGTNDTLSQIGKGNATPEATLKGYVDGMLGTDNNGGYFTTIRSAMSEHNPNANMVVLTIPTWNTRDSWVNEYGQKAPAAILEANERIKEWAASHDAKVVQPDIGLLDVTQLAGNGVPSFFIGGDDNLHPNAQGDVIFAGNVAKQLGIAGRTAGQTRKAVGDDFTLKTTDFAPDGSLVVGKSNGSYSHDWGGASPTGGYTVEFKLDGGIGDGGTAGKTDTWNTTDYFSVSVGAGRTGGTLNIDEAYIRWGDTILYSLNTSTGNLGDGSWDPIRIAYVNGNSTLGLPTGFYVWLGDQLIGEGLGSTKMMDGLSIENHTAGSVTLSELYMDVNSWAPSTTLKTFGNETITSPEPQEYTDFPGKNEWAADTDLLGDEQAIALSSSGVQGSLSDKKGASIYGTGASAALIGSTYTNENTYFTVLPETNVSGTLAVVSGASTKYTGNSHVRFQGGNIGTVIGVQGDGGTIQGVEGALYVEFSPTRDAVVLSGGTQDMWYVDGDLVPKPSADSGKISVSFAGFYAKNATPTVSGGMKLVFNGGVFNGAIFGGAGCINGEDTVVSPSVDLFLNGGLFRGSIFAGGSMGKVGSTSITITGGQGDMEFSSSVKYISVGGAGIKKVQDTPDKYLGGVEDGASVVTLEDITSSDGFADYTGVLSGGRRNAAPTEKEKYRSLTIKNTTVAELKATLEDFDSIVISENSNVGLKGLGSAVKELEIGTGSELGVSSGTYGEVSLSNDGKLVLHVGTTLSATVAESERKGSITVENEGSLTLTAGAAAAAASLDGIAFAAEGPSVQQDVTLQGGGSYTAGTAQMDGVLVTLSGGGQYTVGANVESAQIRLNLTGMTSASSVAASGSNRYNITLVGKNAIEIGEGMKERAFFGTSGDVSLDQDASLTIGLDSIEESLNVDKGLLTYKVANCDLTDWNQNGKVTVARELQLSGWNVNFNERGELVLAKGIDLDADSFTEVKYEVSYENDTLLSSIEGTAITQNAEITVASGLSGSQWKVALLTFVDEGKIDINVKLNGTFPTTSGFDLGESKFDGIASLYLSGTGYFLENGNFNSGGPTTIYINGAQLYFSCYQGNTSDVAGMTSSFVIGEGGSGENGMTGPLAVSKKVVTSGGLTLKTDSSIGFYEGTSTETTMTFGGEVNGSGKNLELVEANAAATKSKGLILQKGGTLGSITSNGTGLSLKLAQAGVLILEDGGTIRGKLIGDGAAGLEVDSGTLSVGTLEGSLSTLSLGENAVLDITDGNLQLTGALGFASGSTIKLNTEGQTITLTDTALQALTLTRAASPLTIELSKTFMGEEASNSITLFTNWKDEWNSLFEFVVTDDDGGTYRNLHVENGKLVWSEEDDETLYWTGTNVTLDKTNGDVWHVGSADGSTQALKGDGSEKLVLEGEGESDTITIGEANLVFDEIDVQNGKFTLTPTPSTGTHFTVHTLKMGGGTKFAATGTAAYINVTNIETRGEAELGWTILEKNEGADARIKLGGKLTIHTGLKYLQWSNEISTNTAALVKVETELGSVDLVLDMTLPTNSVAYTSIYGGIEAGDGKHTVNITKQGSGELRLFEGLVKIFGNLSVEEGMVSMKNIGDSSIQGKLSGSGELRLYGDRGTPSKLTLAQGGSIGVLRLGNAATDQHHTVELGADLVVGKVGFITNSGDNIEATTCNAQITGTAGGTKYLLADAANEASNEWASLESIATTLGLGASTGLSIGDNAGIGVQVTDTKELNDGGTVTQAFKVAGGGTLTLKDSTKGSTFSGGLTLAGGTLELAGSKTVTVGTSLTWTDGTTLKVSGGKDLKIDLTGATFNGGSSSPKLTLNLTSTFLAAIASGYELFILKERGIDSFSDYFDLKVDNKAPSATSYSDLVLNKDGTLTWSVPDPSNSYTWTGLGSTVTLGDNIAEDAAGWDTSGAVDDTKTVTLEGSGEAVTVTVNGGSDNEVSMKSLTVGKVDETATKYTFGVKDDTTTDQTLKVSAGMTINGSATFGNHVKVDAGSSTVAVNGGTTKFESGSALTAGGLTITGSGTVVELSGDTNLTVTGETTLDNGSTLTLGGSNQRAGDSHRGGRRNAGSFRQHEHCDAQRLGGYGGGRHG